MRYTITTHQTQDGGYNTSTVSQTSIRIHLNVPAPACRRKLRHFCSVRTCVCQARQPGLDNLWGIWQVFIRQRRCRSLQRTYPSQRVRQVESRLTDRSPCNKGASQDWAYFSGTNSILTRLGFDDGYSCLHYGNRKPFVAPCQCQPTQLFDKVTAKDGSGVLFRHIPTGESGKGSRCDSLTAR